MKLRQLLQSQKAEFITGSLDDEPTSLVSDSRLVEEGACYVAVRGLHADGHDYIPAALSKGARCIIAERVPEDGESTETVTWIKLANTYNALPALAREWYRHPDRDIKIVGVTGTNGKTTTTFILQSIFKQVWHKAGLIGTVLFDDGEQKYTATHTTPDTLTLQALMAQMTLNDCRGVAMEISSHSLTQNRVAGVEFDVAIFTNLTQDHLDYHGDMDSYFMAKRRLFEMLVEQTENPLSSKKKPVAVINLDSPAGETLVADFAKKLNVKTYGFSPDADFRISLRYTQIKGSEFELHYNGKVFLIKIPLIGRFNVYNAVAALAGAVSAGVPLRDAVKALSSLPQVPGRLEYVGVKDGIMGFVDYAHTPDALANVCKTLKEGTEGRLITIFGCGGDRDRKKRPLMGEAASKNSDLCIVTSDNPRSEDPQSIIDEIIPGVTYCTYRAIPDRKEAVRVACDLARPKDVILLAGKGHEDYQEIAGEKIPFDDKSVLRMAIQNIGAI